MNIIVWLLRILHIGAGILWAGGALQMIFFIGPAISATAQSGQQFSNYLMGKLRLHIFMTILSTTTVLAGGILYWIDSDGFSSAWIYSSAGIGFGIGAGFGIIAFIFGAIFGNANSRLAQFGAQINSKPTNEERELIHRIQNRITFVAPIHTVSLILSVLLWQWQDIYTCYFNYP